MLRNALLVLGSSAALSPGAAAQDLSYSFDPAVSHATVTTGLSLDLNGNLHGVYDATTNPGGTRTILGILGDPGTNADVPLTLELVVDMDLGGALDGTFDLSLNQSLGTVEVTGLAATVGAGASQSADLDLVLSFDTFRTVNPGSLYIGGFPLPLPLGSATITNASLAQTLPGGGVAMPGAAAGTFDVDALVPVELTFDVDLGGLAGGGGGTPMTVGPLPLVLPITGSFDLADCTAPLASVTSETIAQTLPSPFPLDLVDVPLDLPTLLPPGNTANLLLDASLDTITIGGTIDTRVLATATDGRFAATCAGVPNSSGAAGALAATGSASVTAADLSFVATELPTNSLGYLLMSRESDRVPGFGGSQGTLCLGGTIYRFSASVQDSGVLGEVTFAPDFANLPSGQAFAAADTWYFQYWFRDANPTPTSNTTSALRVLFCH